MNTAALNALAETIRAAQTTDRTPMGIAFCIASSGQHLTPEIKAELSRLTARVAELEAAAAKTAEFCAQRAEYVTNLRNCNPDADHDYYRWSGHAAARRQLSQLLGLPVSWPAEDRPGPVAEPLVGTVRTLARMAEEPHDSLLHTDYRLGHDLPEMPHV